MSILDKHAILERNATLLLVGSLLVGSLSARMLALAKQKPFYPIHHVEAHVYANFLIEKQDTSVEPLAIKSEEISAARVRQGAEALARARSEAISDDSPLLREASRAM